MILMMAALGVNPEFAVSWKSSDMGLNRELAASWKSPNMVITKNNNKIDTEDEFLEQIWAFALIASGVYITITSKKLQ